MHKMAGLLAEVVWERQILTQMYFCFSITEHSARCTCRFFVFLHHRLRSKPNAQMDLRILSITYHFYNTIGMVAVLDLLSNPLFAKGDRWVSQEEKQILSNIYLGNAVY